MARTEADVMKYAQGLPTTADLVKAKRMHLKTYGNTANVYFEWDFSKNSIKHRMVRIITEKNGVRHESVVSAEAIQAVLNVT